MPRDHVLDFLQTMVRIDSRNPGLEADGPGELTIALRVREWLREWSWETELYDLGNNRANLVARRAGNGSAPSLMLNVHLDTVGVEGMRDPFSGQLEGGRVLGRGSQDTKGGAAAVLEVARRIAEEHVELGGDLVLAFVADEEHESLGTTELIRHVRTDAAVVLEPSDLDVVIGHRGFGVFRIETHGKAAHGGRADLGVDANRHMGHVLVGLDRLCAKWAESRRHEAMGAATLHVPVIAGGRHLFIYADHCVADVECRTVPGQTEAAVQQELQEVLDEVTRSVSGFQATLELLQWRPPYEIDPSRPIVRGLLECCEAVRGGAPSPAYHTWWEDSALLGEAGIEAVVLGPRGGGLHTENEWVDLASVVDLADILYRFVLRFSSGDSTQS